MFDSRIALHEIVPIALENVGIREDFGTVKLFICTATEGIEVKTVTYEQQNAVGVVTMSKPPHNLLDGTLINDILDAYSRALADGCRSILLRSSMRHFCAGAEVAAFKDGWKGPDEAEMARVIAGLEDIAVPTVAAVNGGALGGGFELALFCDFIVSSDTAFMALPESSLGLLPLLGGVQRITERAGPARAKEFAMFGRRHDPHTLERWGVINLVTAEAELADVSMSYARQLAAGATVALACIKNQANLAAREGSAAADTKQVAMNNIIWASEDATRGVDAFLTTGPASAVFEGK
ncbi:Enoyl-CoA hydratase/carnithine racemase [Burkholderia sp. D7]|nr:Enoyl-CoA hydratase/carnithine racemase [Burkholderia sp. D7]